MLTLLVDDSRTMRAVHRDILSMCGCTLVREAETGAVALDHCDHESPGLVVGDASLPDMRGADLIRTLRARGCRAPVVVVSPELDTPCIVEAINAGADTYIATPCTPDVFALRITQTLARARSA